jgi:glyoxylase-like metal-dependent hydrolase (beta-lactamase superfamily II)
VAELAEGTSAPVYMADAERPALEEPDAVPQGVPLRAHTVEQPLQGDETIEAAGISFEVVRVPGHSPGHIAYYSEGALFSGDVLFAGSVGRTDLPFGDWDTLLDSIRLLLDRFPPKTTVYSGHGPPTTLAAELERNPFLDELRAERQSA